MLVNVCIVFLESCYVWIGYIESGFFINSGLMFVLVIYRVVFLLRVV